MAALAEEGTWKHCNICKAPIAYRAEYFVCSVSTCNRKRTGLNFCSLPCFEAHLPTARHRDAWAERVNAPSLAEWQAALATSEGSTNEAAPPRSPERRVVAAAPERAGAPERRIVTAASTETATDEADVLVVVSKLKKYVRDWSGMNTSDGAMSVLSEHLRELCREATRQAGMEGRRTVLDRDFTKVLSERREATRKGDFDSRR
jgi:histone H3/H4